MSRRLLDEMALGASGLSALDEAVRSLTATSAIYDLQRTAADLLELSSTTAMQRQLEEATQKIAPPLPKVVESALSLSKSLIAAQALGVTAARHLETVGNMVTAKDAASYSLKGTAATAANYATESLLGITAKQQGLLSNFAEQLDYRHYFVEDSLSRIAKESLASLHSMTALWDDQLAQPTKALVDSYRVLQAGQQDLFSTTFRHLEEQIREARTVAFPPVAAMADQLFEALRMQLPASVLEATFTGELLGRLQSAEAATSEAEREDVLAELFVWFVEKFNELPQSLLTWMSARDIFLGVVIPFIFYLLSAKDAVSKKDLVELRQQLRQDSAYSGPQDAEKRSRLEQNLGEQISRAREDILQKIEEHRQTASPCQHYVSIKQVNLRESPMPKGRLIKKLAPNVIFEEIKEQGQWLHVEVFDYAREEIKRGWIFKRNLLLVQDQEISCRVQSQEGDEGKKERTSQQ